jgi:hypothetical protein
VHKLVLMSVLIATFVIPVTYATRPNPKRSLRRMQRSWAIFCFIYVVMIGYVMQRL